MVYWGKQTSDWGLSDRVGGGGATDRGYEQYPRGSRRRRIAYEEYKRRTGWLHPAFRGGQRPESFGPATRKFLETVGYFKNQPAFLGMLADPMSPYFIGAGAFDPRILNLFKQAGYDIEVTNKPGWLPENYQRQLVSAWVAWQEAGTPGPLTARQRLMEQQELAEPEPEMPFLKSLRRPSYPPRARWLVW